MSLRQLKKQLQQQHRQTKRSKPTHRLWLLVLVFAVVALWPLYQRQQQTAPQRLYAAAVKQESMGEITAAQQLYQELYQNYADSELAAEALLRTGKIWQYDQRQDQQALLSYLQLEHDYPDHPLAQTAREAAAHIVKYSLRDYSRAISYYQRLLEHPTGQRDQYLYEIADSYFRLDNYSQARIELETLLEERPQTPLLPDVLYRKGGLLLLENRLAEARHDWQRLVEEFPDSSYSVQARFNLAKLLEEEDRLQEALKLYRQLQDFPRPSLLREKIEHLQQRIKAKKEGDVMQNSRNNNFAVIGAGSWGTTLANLLAGKGYPVTLWVYETDLAERMEQTRVNDIYLPDFKLADKIACTANLQEAVRGKNLLLFVSPSQVTRKVLQEALPVIEPRTILVCASKGIENDSLRLMSQVFEELLPEPSRNRLGFLSGPSFAKEVAQGMPTAVVAAARKLTLAEEIQGIFSTEKFRVYTHDDIIGVELGGAMKNVIALAAGVADGLGFGYNSRAGLITRGLAEMTRLGLALGGRAETFAGLAGMGDLVLTCTGDLSRNRTVGIELGRGRKLEEILAGMQMVAEGVKTTLSAYQLAGKLGVEVPIIEQMYLILYRDKDPRQAVNDLMLRDLKPESVRSQ